MNEIHAVLDRVLADNRRAEIVVTEKQVQEIMFMTYGYSYDETRRAQEALQKSNKAIEAEMHREETEADKLHMDSMKKSLQGSASMKAKQDEDAIDKLTAQFTKPEKPNYWVGEKSSKEWPDCEPKQEWSGLNSATPSDWDAVRPDMVNSPAHYMQGGIETIDFIEAKLTPEEFRGYLKGNVLKYASRMGNKGSMRLDAGKAAWYSNRIVETN